MSSTYILSLFAIAVVIVFFRPLLLGVVKALVLVVKPRLTIEQRRARAAMRDRAILQRAIDSSNGPSHAAELRAMSSRG